MERPTVRHGAWVARYLGRGALASLRPEDIEALAGELDESHQAGGTKVFAMVLAGGLPAQLASVLFRETERGAVQLSQQLLADDLSTSQVGEPA